MLLVVPEVPGRDSLKPLIQGYGARLRGDALSCEALFVESVVPDQTLDALLLERHKRPRRVRLEWSEIPPGLYQHAEIDVRRDA